jgi:hypothetical protein
VTENRHEPPSFRAEAAWSCVGLRYTEALPELDRVGALPRKITVQRRSNPVGATTAAAAGPRSSRPEPVATEGIIAEGR